MQSDRISKDALRFLFAGSINTAATSVIYLIGLMIMPPTASYAIAWLAGIIFVVGIYPDKVFPGGRRSMVDRGIIAAITIAVFLIGILTLRHLTSTIGPIGAFSATLILTTSLNFLLCRLAVRRT